MTLQICEKLKLIFSRRFEQAESRSLSLQSWPGV
jgi:hypothetical protein